MEMSFPPTFNIRGSFLPFFRLLAGRSSFDMSGGAGGDEGGGAVLMGCMVENLVVVVERGWQRRVCLTPRTPKAFVTAVTIAGLILVCL